VPRACVFCQREAKLTLEHVLPSWLARHLPHAERVTSVTHSQRVEGEGLRLWTTDVLDIKVKRVCEDCNTGWMHELEDAARPILLPLMAGRTRGLASSEQEVIAVWAIKTALMCEFTHPRSRGASEEHFRFIYESLKPTPSSQVWLSHYIGPKELGYNHRDLRMEPEDRATPSKKGYLAAFILNRLVLYVMDVQGVEGVRTDLSKHAERAVLQVQPVKWVYPRWPPEVAYGDKAVEGFLHMIAPTRAGVSTEKG
jgi:hypothetical protein